MTPGVLRPGRSEWPWLCPSCDLYFFSEGEFFFPFLLFDLFFSLSLPCSFTSHALVLFLRRRRPFLASHFTNSVCFSLPQLFTVFPRTAFPLFVYMPLLHHCNYFFPLNIPMHITFQSNPEYWETCFAEKSIMQRENILLLGLHTKKQRQVLFEKQVLFQLSVPLSCIFVCKDNQRLWLWFVCE